MVDPNKVIAMQRLKDLCSTVPKLEFLLNKKCSNTHTHIHKNPCQSSLLNGCKVINGVIFIFYLTYLTILHDLT